MKSINENNFNKEVIESTIPVIVNFWAPWCGVCRLIEPVLNQLQANFPATFKVVRINADENFRLCCNYRLTSLPTLLIFEQGEIVQRFDPLQAQGDLRTALRQMIEQFSPTPCLQGSVISKS